MPVYEYVCCTCTRAFEELVLGEESIACPACASQDVAKQFSTFATSHVTLTPASRSTPSDCGTCGDPRGPGACARD